MKIRGASGTAFPAATGPGPSTRPPPDPAALHALTALCPYVRVAREEQRPPWRIPERRLFDFLVVYILAGIGRFTVGAETFPVEAGDFIWIPPNTPHTMESRATPQHLLYAHFDLIYAAPRSLSLGPPIATLQDPIRQAGLMHPPVEHLGIQHWCGRLPVVNGAKLHQILKRMAYEELTARNPLTQAGLVFELLGAIHNGLHPGPAPNPHHQRALQRAADRILTNAAGPLDVTGLAREARLSLPHFRRLFRALHGQSPRELHQFAKMQQACEWLDYATWNISEIATRLGFTNVHNFSRAFKVVVGRAPSAYRARNA